MKMHLPRKHGIRKESRLKEDENAYGPGRSDKVKSKDSTENFLRMIWELLVWPLILENNRAYFAVACSLPGMKKVLGMIIGTPNLSIRTSRTNSAREDENVACLLKGC
jgi:hypothetical protein